jgi:uncharacterized membrane protein YdjX (TVP38/TMEM64 family)
MGHAIASRAKLAVRHPATLVAVVLAVAFGIAVLVHPGTWATFTALAGGDKETLRDMILGFGVFAPVASIALNVMQAVVAPVPGFVVPFVNGAVFGTWWGMAITWVGGIAASATCFWIARTFGRRFAERICRQFTVADEINRKLERHAFAAIFLGRFVPGVPFDFLSYFVGLTRVRFSTFIVATALGSAPHAYVYAFMGSSLEIPLWVGVLMTPALGVVYAAAKYGVRALRAARRHADGGSVIVSAIPVAGTASAGSGSLAAWTAAPAAVAVCREGRAVPLPAWATRRRVTSAGPAPSCSPA